MSGAGEVAADIALPPLYRLVAAYARGADRPVFHALFDFDAMLARIARQNHEPMLAAIRLQWWRDVMEQSPGERPRGNPRLAALTALETPGQPLSALVPVIDAWDALIDAEARGEGDTPETRVTFANGRAALFLAIARWCQPARRSADLGAVETAGRLWAQWDRARHMPDPDRAAALLHALKPGLSAAGTIRMPRQLRPLSILLRLAKLDIAAPRPDQPLLRPATAGRIVWYGLTGR